MTDLVEMGISVIRVIFGVILIMFIPGYAAIWALFPEKSRISLVERFAYSCVTSIGLTMVSVLSLDLIIGVDTTPVNITFTLILVTLFFGSAGVISHLLQPRIWFEKKSVAVREYGKFFYLRLTQRIKTLFRR